MVKAMRIEDTVKDILRHRLGEIEQVLDLSLINLTGTLRRLVPDPGNPGGCDAFGCGLLTCVGKRMLSSENASSKDYREP